MKTTPTKSKTKPVRDGERGNLDYEKEIKPLIMAACEAYACQDPDISFDDFRAEHTLAAVNRDGFRYCTHDHFCDLMGHFKTLAGKDSEALFWFIRGASNAQRQRAWTIVDRLNAHIALAKSTEEQIIARTSPKQLSRTMARRNSILNHPEGMLDVGYLLTIVRDKTRKPQLAFGPDIVADLAGRCTMDQLLLIRHTLINRISEREGVGSSATRNKSQKSPEAKARRSPGTLAPRYTLP